MACNNPGISVVGSMVIAAQSGNRAEMERLVAVIQDDEEERREFYRGFANLTECDARIITDNYSELLVS